MARSTMMTPVSPFPWFVLYFNFQKEFQSVRVSEDQEIDQDDIPRCKCDTPGILRPNIVLFEDDEWNSDRADEQEIEYKTFMEYV